MRIILFIKFEFNQWFNNIYNFISYLKEINNIMNQQSSRQTTLGYASIFDAVKSIQLYDTLYPSILYIYVYNKIRAYYKK